MTTRTRQSGFALMMTLALVLLAGTTLAGLARRSLAQAIDARGAVEELQRRWAITSSRATLLRRAEQILDHAERGDAEQPTDPSQPAVYENSPMAELRVTCRLVDTDYLFVITDEQAKLNVNTMNRRTITGDPRMVVSQLANEGRTQASTRVKVRLRAKTSPDDRRTAEQEQGPDRFASYGQVFEQVTPAELVGDSERGGLARSITCWGGGKVNVRRASPAVLRRACEKRLGRDAVRALIEARREDPYRPLGKLLSALGSLDDKQTARANACLTDQSNCHGLWIIVQGKQRTWHTLSIGLSGKADGDDGGAGDGLQQRFDFTW